MRQLPRFLSCLCLASSLGLATAQSPGPSSDRFRAGDRAVVSFRVEAGLGAIEEIKAVAAWARSQKLYAWAANLNAGILTLDADDRQARAALRYFRVGEEWRQSPGFLQPRNHAPKSQLEELAREYQERLDQALGPYRDGILVRLVDPRQPVSPSVKEELLRQLMVFEPEDEQLRRANGEARMDDRWILVESARTLSDEGDLRARAAKLIAGVPEPEHGTITSDERKSKLALKQPLKTKDVRVTGTVTGEEVKRSARLAQAVGGLFAEVFRQPAQFRRGYSVMMLRGPKDLGRLQAMVNVPNSPPVTSENMATHGGWLSNRQVAQWSPDPKRRADGLARQTMGAMLMDSYGLDSRHGWIWEGVGLFLTHQLVGTRRTYFVEQPAIMMSDSDNLWLRLVDDDADWLEIAAQRHAEGRWPGLAFLVGRRVGTMRDEDLLVSYVLAAYVIQGWPRRSGELMQAIGSGEHPVKAFESVLGWTLPQLEERLVRWLAEVR